MATKWKNRGLMVAILVLFTFGINGVLTILNSGSTYLNKDYFHTGEFEGELYNFIDGLGKFELNPVTKDERLKDITVTNDEIAQYRSRYGDLSQQISNVKGEYDWQIAEAQNNGNSDAANLLIKYKEKKIEEIQKEMQDDEYVKTKILAEKQKAIENYYLNIESNKGIFFQNKSAFTYYLKNSETGEVFTNMSNPSKEEIKNGANLAFFRNYPSSSHPSIQFEKESVYSETNGFMVPLKANTGHYEGQIAILSSSGASNFILEKSQNYKERQILFVLFSIVSLLALVLCFYLFKKTKKIQSSYLEMWRPFYHRIPLDIRIVLFLVTAIGTLNIFYSYGPTYVQLDVRNEIDRIIRFMCVTPLVGLTFIQGIYLFKGRRDLKEEWKGSLLNKWYQLVKEAFLNWRVGTQLLVLLFIVFAFGSGFILVIVENNFFVPYLFSFIVIGIPVGFLIIKQAGYFNRIFQFASNLAARDYGHELSISGKSVFGAHAKNLNVINEQLKLSQTEQAKSERLKVELISNVSHDLRTPLTSIITYTELLKTPNLDNDERQSYIQIIDRKSKRLKVLIDDLFEVSKMASGNIELMKEKVDICQLLDQALGEYSETLEGSTLDIRVTKPETPVFVIVDGQKMWRVFDNLIGNIFKYSLENTRVYISVEAIENKIVLTFKNISKFELGRNTDEMLERFKRGDTSRHTEGSGLGLAIAKSIIDLHGGNLEIEADGDLIKVTLTL